MKQQPTIMVVALVGLIAFVGLTLMLGGSSTPTVHDHPELPKESQGPSPRGPSALPAEEARHGSQELPEMAEEEPVPARTVPGPPVWVLKGMIVDEEAKPVSGVRVECDLKPMIDPAVSFEDGRFEMQFRHEGSSGGLSIGAIIHVNLSKQGFVGRREDIHLDGPGGMFEHEFRMSHAVGIRGRVTDQFGNVVQGAVARIQVDEINGTASVTAADGTFTLDEVPVGEWNLEVAPPYADSVGLWGQRSVFVNVRAGATPVEVVLKRAVADPQPPRVTARIVIDLTDGKTGEPITAKAAISIRTDVVPGAPQEPVPKPGITHGMVQFDEIPQGNWRIWVHLQDGSARFLDTTVDGTSPVVNGRLVTGAAGSLTGRLLPDGGDFTHGVKLTAVLAQGARVPAFAIGPDPQHSGRTSGGCRVREDGTFLIEALIPGRYQVSCLDKWVSAAAVVEVDSGTDTAIDLMGRKPSEVAFSGASLQRDGYAVFKVWVEGLPNPVEETRKVTAGKPWMYTVSVHPGTLTWWAAVRTSRYLTEGEDSVGPRTGHAQVDAGCSVKIHVDADGEEVGPEMR